ncbi:hypothetical protein [Nocardia sp. IFM 10818]
MTTPAEQRIDSAPIVVAPQLRAQLAADEPRPTVIACAGLGVDSTALLMRLILNPHLRDWGLDQLVVITAMVGDEWDQTGIDFSEVMLPLFRRYGIRYIQVGRHRRKVTKAGVGVRVFSDTRDPQVLHFGGDFRLSDEMLRAGTIPQTGGKRLCSVHAKGDCLDPVIAALTDGQPYRHLIGFEVTETARAIKDTRFNTATRTGEYPLMTWGWTRADAAAYLLKQTGRYWQKSACVYCPYSLSNQAGRQETFARYRRIPAAGARMLWLEHVALCLNPKQGLIGGRRAVDHVRDAGLTAVLDQFRQALETGEHAIYEVRRVTRASDTADTKPERWRSIRPIAHGSRSQMLADLDKLPGVSVVGEDGITRRVVRDGQHPDDSWAEHFWVAAPAGVQVKSHAGFEALWRQATRARRRRERHLGDGWRDRPPAPRARKTAARHHIPCLVTDRSDR